MLEAEESLWSTKRKKGMPLSLSVRCVCVCVNVESKRIRRKKNEVIAKRALASSHAPPLKYSKIRRKKEGEESVLFYFASFSPRRESRKRKKKSRKECKDRSAERRRMVVEGGLFWVHDSPDAQVSSRKSRVQLIANCIVESDVNLTYSIIMFWAPSLVNIS